MKPLSITLCLLIIPLIDIAAQEYEPLSGESLETARQIAETAIVPIRPSQVADNQPLQLVMANAIMDESEAELAELTYFDYASGKTIRTIVDLEEKITIKTNDFEAYPAPLAKDEEERAVELARESSDPVKALYANGDVSFYAMAPVISDREDKRFGHRIVFLTFTQTNESKSDQVRVEVNLTNNSISELPINKLPEARDNQAESDASPLSQAEPLPEGPRVIEQLFPVNAPPADQETGWRIEYGITRHAGTGEILYIRRAQFRPSEEEAWFDILGDSRLVEMFVPYSSGSPRFYDIALGFQLDPVTSADLGPACIAPGQIRDGGKVALELHDNHTLWMDTSGNSRRVEEIHLWSVYRAGNYKYIILYVFRSDGSIGFRVGATAHNLYSSRDEFATHLHVGCWRLSVDLGDASACDFKIVEFDSTPATGAVTRTDVTPFNGGLEGGIEWKADKFSQLRIESTRFKNNHQPPSYISYDLLMNRAGNARTYGSGEEWTHKDIWITHAKDSLGLSRLILKDIPSEIGSSPQPTSNEPSVIWCKAGLVHRARDEDFGRNGYSAADGAAVTAWTGFDLKPRNLLSSTPLFP